jgi:hypothetical protein
MIFLLSFFIGGGGSFALSVVIVCVIFSVLVVSVIFSPPTFSVVSTVILQTLGFLDMCSAIV